MDDAAPLFFVKNSRKRFCDHQIGLITGDDEVGHRLAAILDPGVSKAAVIVGDDFIGQAQLKIADTAVGPDEECVVPGWILGSG